MVKILRKILLVGKEFHIIIGEDFTYAVDSCELRNSQVFKLLGCGILGADKTRSLSADIQETRFWKDYYGDFRNGYTSAPFPGLLLIRQSRYAFSLRESLYGA